MAAVAHAAGRRTGLHTSPHLWRLTERLRVDGQPAPDAWLADAVARYDDALDALGPSFFEATVALSFRYFADAAVDLAVVEVGLGGRLDATNVLAAPAACAITPIGLDHAALLGDTLPAIAREKAGIVKPGVPVATAAAPPDVRAVFAEVAAARGAPWHPVAEETTLSLAADDAGGDAMAGGAAFDLVTPARRYAGLRVGLPGAHQRQNAALAVRTLEVAWPRAFGAPLPAAAVRTGLAEVTRRAGLRGRLDVLARAPLTVADVAHNPDALAVTLDALRPALAAEADARLHVVLGLLRDKDAAAMARLLADAGAVVTPVPLDGARARPAGDLAAVLRRHGVAVRPPAPAAAAVARLRAEASPGDVLLVTGSHRVVAQLPEALDV
jgi:dihydrofolate synthase/folylpolyglutamate synthase